MHRESNMLGNIVMAQRLPWHMRWKRHFRGLDFSKARHHTPYAPSGVFTFGFALLFAMTITVMQVTS